MAQIPKTYKHGWLESLDGRTTVAQEMRRRFDCIISDMGGPDGLSYARRALVERAIWVEYWLQSQERNLAAGQDFDSGRYTQAVNSLIGLFAKLGLERQAKNITLNDYIVQQGAGS